jgi:hypothetical protein
MVEDLIPRTSDRDVAHENENRTLHSVSIPVKIDEVPLVDLSYGLGQPFYLPPVGVEAKEAVAEGFVRKVSRAIFFSLKAAQ